MEKIIKFQGEIYLLIDEGKGHGAIAKEEDFIHGRCSYAHLFEDGTIMRFGEQIGTKDDIEIIGEKEVEVPDVGEALYNTLFSYWGP